MTKNFLGTKKTFFDFIPTPRFLEMPSVGLAISDASIQFVELVNLGSRIKLGNYASRTLPQGAISGGFIYKPDEVVKVLKELKEKYNLKFVKASLPEEKAYLFKVDLPRAAENDFHSNIEFILEENAPIALPDAIFDYIIFENEPSKPTLGVAVSVVPKSVAESYIDVIREAGLAPLALEVESQAISRAVVSANQSEPCLVVNINKQKTALYLVTSGVVHFTLNLNFGRDSMDEIKEEIKKVYWHGGLEKPGEESKKFGKIIICGEALNINGVASLLSHGIGVPASVANVWTNAFFLGHFIPDISFEDSLAFAAAIGLALSNNYL